MIAAMVDSLDPRHLSGQRRTEPSITAGTLYLTLTRGVPLYRFGPAI